LFAILRQQKSSTESLPLTVLTMENGFDGADGVGVDFYGVLDVLGVAAAHGGGDGDVLLFGVLEDYFVALAEALFGQF